MKKSSLFILVIGSILMSCHTGSDKEKKAIVKTDTAAYYPVDAFFRSEKEYVDLRDVVIKQQHTLNGKKDSAIISKEQFLAWAALFSQQGDRFRANKAFFKEDVFKDQSTQSYTLTYTPVDTLSNNIQHLDVLLDENTHQPKRVFIKATHVAGDTATTEQYSWRSMKSFQFTRFISAHNFTSVEVSEVSWEKK